MEIELDPKHTLGGAVTKMADGWRLEIPAGRAGAYRLAQVDDYARLPRSRLKSAPPRSLSLDARLSQADLPGTWGFGLWNDPFGFAIGFGGTVRRLPCLPNTAWFFNASPPNWLSLREDLPGDGFFCGTMRSAHIPLVLLAPALLTLPFLSIRPLSRLLRRVASRLIPQDAATIHADVTDWHHYSFEWIHAMVEFKVDGQTILRTDISPIPPLGLVIWIDNQYAAWNPAGRIGYGTLETPSGWLEVAHLHAGV